MVVNRVNDVARGQARPRARRHDGSGGVESTFHARAPRVGRPQQPPVSNWRSNRRLVVDAVGARCLVHRSSCCARPLP